MTAHTISGFITYRKTPWSEEPEVQFYEYDPTGYDIDKGNPRVVVCAHSFDVEVPDDFDPRPQMVAALETEKQKVRAAFAARVTEIDAQIQSLLALEAA